jgi:ubiquinone/menaquinone biosynthesis C-methylase UbiE
VAVTSSGYGYLWVILKCQKNLVASLKQGKTVTAGGDNCDSRCKVSIEGNESRNMMDTQDRLSTESSLAEQGEYYALVKKAFDRLAPFYDVIALPIARIRDIVVAFTNAGAGSSVLDVATGTGQQAFAFAQKGYQVVGIDLSEAMLGIAIKKNKVAGVQFEVADATHLCFADNSFAVACVSFALHDMPLSIMQKTLKEMVRVTKPKGLIVVVDYALPTSRIGNFLIYRLIRLYESDYYARFINADLKALFSHTGIEIIAECPVLLGAGQIWKGIKV